MDRSNQLHSDASSRQDEVNPEDAKLWGSKRLKVAMFMFFGYILAFILRGNLSIALVDMTSNKTKVEGNQTIVQMPEFNWDSETKGWILSVYSYGYFFIIIGGYLSTKYGGVKVNALCILSTALLTTLSPTTVRSNWYIFGVCRIAEGILEGFAYTGTCDIWSRWMPKKELAKIISFCHSGSHVGAALTFPICGLIAQYYGWPMIFYITGAVAIVWSVLFLSCASSDPQSDRSISVEELQYIRRTIGLKDRKKITYPWKKIFTSTPLWALCFNKFAFGWAQISIVFCFPLYIKDITNQSTAMVGLLSGIPNYVNLFVAPISGLFIDYLQNNRGCDSSKLLKFIVTAGFLTAGILLVAVGFSSFIVAMIYFVIVDIVLSININILQIMVCNISSDHAGFLAGISALSFTLSSTGAPLAIGYIVTDHTWQEWSICFGMGGGILILAAAITALFGSSEDQKWLLTQDRVRKLENDEITTLMH